MHAAKRLGLTRLQRSHWRQILVHCAANNSQACVVLALIVSALALRASMLNYSKLWAVYIHLERLCKHCTTLVQQASSPSILILCSVCLDRTCAIGKKHLTRHWPCALNTFPSTL